MTKKTTTTTAPVASVAGTMGGLAEGYAARPRTAAAQCIVTALPGGQFRIEGHGADMRIEGTGDPIRLLVTLAHWMSAVQREAGR